MVKGRKDKDAQRGKGQDPVFPAQFFGESKEGVSRKTGIPFFLDERKVFNARDA